MVTEAGGNELLHMRLRGSEIKSTFFNPGRLAGALRHPEMGELGCQVLMLLPPTLGLAPSPDKPARTEMSRL